MEPTPVPRTPVSQRIGASAAAESKEDDASAAGGALVLAQQDCVDTWSTDKIETFAPAAEQMIVVRSVGKPHWKVFRTMSILLLTSRGAACCLGGLAAGCHHTRRCAVRARSHESLPWIYPRYPGYPSQGLVPGGAGI